MPSKDSDENANSFKSDQTVSLLAKQCVKLGNFKSNFQSILKGVPQGSILGPVLFNIFINDIFHFIKNCKLYNYADDNTVSHTDTDLKRLIDELVEDSTRLIQWFADNQMKANPGKFQAIAVGKRTHSENICFNLGENIVSCEDNVKLLGVTIDFKLDFDEHISNVCKKASRQLNVLKRIGGHLCKLGKLNVYLSPLFFKKASGILQSPPSVRPSVRPSVTLSPPKPLDEIQPNLVCELLT